MATRGDELRMERQAEYSLPLVITASSGSSPNSVTRDGWS